MERDGFIMSVIKDLQFRQGNFELMIKSFDVLDQGVTAVIGPSGSGKSTLLRILLGLERLSGWSWNFKGRNIAELSVSERKFGVVFQSLDLFPHMTAEENILFVAQCRIDDKAEQKRQTQMAIERLGIQKVKGQMPFELSGGEKQRVALARALVSRPDFLFLDEPFSSLDEETKRESRSLVGEVLREQNIPALLISHDKEDVRELASLVHVLKEGRVVAG